MHDLGVAIFGAGRAGHGHARAIAETAGAHLVAIFDADRRTRRRVRRDPRLSGFYRAPTRCSSATTSSW